MATGDEEIIEDLQALVDACPNCAGTGTITFDTLDGLQSKPCKRCLEFRTRLEAAVAAAAKKS